MARAHRGTAGGKFLAMQREGLDLPRLYFKRRSSVEPKVVGAIRVASYQSVTLMLPRGVERKPAESL